MIPMVNEVIRCYEEGIISSPQKQTALVYGLGFPPFRGGIFRYLDDTGTRAFCEKQSNTAHWVRFIPFRTVCGHMLLITLLIIRNRIVTLLLHSEVYMEKS